MNRYGDSSEKIRTLIQNHYFGIKHTITISMGVGEYQQDENIDQILGRIDEALLKAKSKGRNRMESC